MEQKSVSRRQAADLTEKILHLQRYFRGFALRSQLMQKAGLTPMQLLVLSAVWQKRKINMTELGRMATVSGQQLTRIVNDLFAMGLVQREVDMANRRFVLVSLTERGKRHMVSCKKSVSDALYDEMLSMETGDVERIQRAVADITHALRRLVESD
jgi:DNA-binding MarR family transcriptional regulator